MSFTTADLYEVAKIIFPNSFAAATFHQFHNDLRRQYIVIAAIHEFAKGDKFFKAFGDCPMPSYTPPGIGKLVGLLAKSVMPASLEKRLTSNHILRMAVRNAYEPWWQNPELWVR